MRSRLAITSLLALGLLMTGSGAALGVTALNNAAGSAAQAQYGSGGGGGEVLGGQGSVGDGLGDGGNVLGDEGSGGEGVAGEDDVLGTADSSAASPVAVAREAAAQESRQLAADESGGEGGGELPFTGFAAIPILLIGTVLLAAGLLLRRDTRRSPAQT